MLVASLSSNTEYPCIIKDLVLAFEFEVLEVVASFFEGHEGVFVEPGVPDGG